MSIKVVDLFAGAGGFSEGFLRSGFDIVAHVEMEKDACSTIITRAVYYALKERERLDVYRKYLLKKISMDEIIKTYHFEKERDSVICAKIGKNNYQDIIDSIKQRLGNSPLDMIIGGPPCQAYSMVGRARDKDGMKRDDRNHLYKFYVKFLIGLKPKVFIFENVPGLKTAGDGRYLKAMQKLMKQAGYTTDLKILNAADYGVPQNRKRVILIGWNKESKLKKYPDFEKILRTYKVSDFFNDLPIVKRGSVVSPLRYKENSQLLEQLNIRDVGEIEVFDHVTREHIPRDLAIYKIALARQVEGSRLQYNELPDRLKTHNNQVAFLDRYKVVDSSQRASQTIVAHISKDGHYFIHPDRKQLRSLSVREAARLQTFPDNYKFEGSRTAQLKQIGNAVPPMLSTVLARELKRYI